MKNRTFKIVKSCYFIFYPNRKKSQVTSPLTSISNISVTSESRSKWLERVFISLTKSALLVFKYR